jgi:glycosyltransferase 2 family protein
MSRLVILLIKVLLSVTLIWQAFSQANIGTAIKYLGSVSPTVIFVALFLLFSEFFIAASRLRLLLGFIGIRCSMIRAIDLVMIGAFFSQTLVSFLGGDAMRVWRMVQTDTPVGLAATSILFDRVAGFVGLLLITVLGLPWLFETVSQPAMRLGLVTALLVGAGAVSALFLTRFIPTALRRWRGIRWASELSAVAFTILKNQPGLLALIALSIAIHLLTVLALYLMSVALEMEVSLASMLVLVPPVLLISMLPISVAGWGVREGAMVFALNLVGTPPYQSLALSVCFGLSVLAVSLPGGVLWFLTRKQVTSQTAGVAGLSSKD